MLMSNGLVPSGRHPSNSRIYHRESALKHSKGFYSASESRRDQV